MNTNTIIKTAVASALALGASGAYAAGVPAISSGSSDLILVVDAFSGTSSTGAYALDTGIKLSSLMSPTSTAYTVGAAANSTAFTGINSTVNVSATLTAFLSAHTGNTIEWTVEGGQYTGQATSSFGLPAGPSNNNTAAAGAALNIFTSQLANNATGNSTKTISFLSGLRAGLGASGDLAPLGTSAESSSVSQTLGDNEKYGYFGASDLSLTGVAVKLWGFTGNGTSGSGSAESYILGTATLSSTGTLTFAANPTSSVPLPAAVWLFGSGVMGLVGVSRRRKTTV
jgi:hypothetical protein